MAEVFLLPVIAIMGCVGGEHANIRRELDRPPLRSGKQRNSESETLDSSRDEQTEQNPKKHRSKFA